MVKASSDIGQQKVSGNKTQVKCLKTKPVLACLLTGNVSNSISIG